MTWVKICGMTNLEDALVAVDAGADAVGFVFYEKSPRCVTVNTAREIIAKLPEHVEKVGVFVGRSKVAFGIEFADSGLTAVQNYLLAGEEQPDPEGAKAMSISLFPTLRKSFIALSADYFLNDEENSGRLAANFKQLKAAGPGQPNMPEGIFDTLLVDSGGIKKPGGTGETFDWHRAVPVVDTMQQGGLKVIVAGGLTPENVENAISILKPWGVDVVSGVETRPGKKDPEKVRAFVRAVREMDRRVS